MAAGQTPRKPWRVAAVLLNLQQICSKLTPFVAEILGFSVFRAANQQRISSRQATHLGEGWRASAE